MILHTNTFSDHFTIVRSNAPREGIGIVNIHIKNRFTDKSEILSIDPYAELLSYAFSPRRKSIFLNKMANKGFFISPIDGLLEEFFHSMLFPGNVSTVFGEIKIEYVEGKIESTSISSGHIEVENE